MEGHVRKVTRIPKSKQYASGNNTICNCPICGIFVPYRSMVQDWRGQWVCQDCNDLPPASYLQPVAPVDAIALDHFRGEKIDNTFEMTLMPTILKFNNADDIQWTFAFTEIVYMPSVTSIISVNNGFAFNESFVIEYPIGYRITDEGDGRITDEGDYRVVMDNPELYTCASNNFGFIVS